MPVYHLTSQYVPSDPDAVRRHAVAAESWKSQPWHEMPVSRLPRSFAEEGQELPYIRDLFSAACDKLQPADIVVFTNRDICVRSDCAVQIATHLQQSEACYSYRMDFGHRLEHPPTDEQISQGRLYPGSDLVAFRVRWWLNNRNTMPDMLIAREATDPVLRQLVDETNVATAPNELPGLIAHERHGGNVYWEHPDNRYRLHGQLHNLVLAKKFFLKRKIDPAQFGIRGV